MPKSLNGIELLGIFRENDAQMVFVIDEYGEGKGLVTLQNILEAMTGEFPQGESGNLKSEMSGDASWLLDGLLPIQDLKDRLGLSIIPDEGLNCYHTLGGMMFNLMGHIPETFEHCTWESWRFEVIEMDGRRIDKVLASRIVE